MNKWKYPEDAERSIHMFCNDSTIYSFYTPERFQTIIKKIRSIGFEKFNEVFDELNAADDALLAFAHLPGCPKQKEMTDPFDKSGHDTCQCNKGEPVHLLRVFAGYFTFLDYERYPDDVRKVLITFIEICRKKKLSAVFDAKSEDDQFLQLMYDLFTGVQSVNYHAELMHFIVEFLKRYVNQFKNKKPNEIDIYEAALKPLIRYNSNLWKIRNLFIEIAKSIKIDAEEWHMRF